MTQDAEKQTTAREGDIREIPTWARRYAQNRTLPVVVNLVIFVLGFAAIGGLSGLTGWAYFGGQRTLAAGLMVALAGVLAFWVWYSIAGGAAITRRVTERLYRGEGHVSIGAPPETVGAGTCRQFPLVGYLFMFCILAHVGLGVMGLLPIRYMQPMSAIYLVPFLVWMAVKMRGMGSPFMALWPVLYALYAIAYMAWPGMRFGERLEPLNMLVPVVGCVLVAALAGHVYSRVALRRLKSLAGGASVLDEGEEGAQ